MDRGGPTRALGLLHRQPGELEPELIGVVDPAVRPGGPDDSRDEVGQGVVLLLTGTQRLLRLPALGLLPLLDRCRHVLRRGVAVFGLLRQRSQADRLQSGRDVGTELAGRRRLLLQDLPQHLGACSPR